MRDILFRAKRKDNGEWVHGYYVKYGYAGNEKDYIVPAYASALYAFEVIPETVGQWTGLTDKNGVKIFEGDIIGVYGYDYEEPSFDEYGEVIFTPLGVGIYFEKDNGESDILYLCELQGSYLTQYEKFGKIYDNPELLKGDTE